MSPVTEVEEAPTLRCPACLSTVPAGPFCGDCGAPGQTRRTFLRPATFAAAPRQRLMWPLVTSSLFPHLPARDRTPFRHALYLVLAMLISLSALRSLGPLVVVVSLGIPLLFGMYVWRSEAFSGISAPALVTSTVLGAGLGTAWWLWSGAMLATAYDIPLGAASQMQSALGLGLVITLGGTALMVLPTFVVRVLPQPARESLDGFLIGALSALSYSAAGTIAWLAPQFVAGLLDNYSPSRLLEEAALYGMVDPLTGAAAGGAVGLALWFRPAHRGGRQPRHVRVFLWALAAVAVALYMGIYLVDAAQLPRFWEIAINTVITAVAMVTVRIGVQTALLYESPDESPEESPVAATYAPVRCERCRHSVPDMSFCPQCGAAKRALSRSARRLRRQSPPEQALDAEEGR